MVSNENSQDRRRFKRVKASFIVTYRVKSPLYLCIQIGDRQVNAILLDISEGGMAVLTNYDIPAFSVITVKFIMFNDLALCQEDKCRSIDVQGEVRYSLLIKREYRLGIRFVDISNDDKAFIANFVKMKSLTEINRI